MPRPRTPTSILKATGALAHDSKRYASRASEPKPTGELGIPPKHLTAPQKKVWKELALTAPVGVLTSADRWIVEAVVLLMSKVRTGEYTAADIGHLRAGLASLGMTPADRSRVSVMKEAGPTDAFAQFMNNNDEAEGKIQ